MSLHNEATPARVTRGRGETGLVCLVCNRGKGKPVRVVVESPSGTELARHDAALCADCMANRFMARAAAERTTRRET